MPFIEANVLPLVGLEIPGLAAGVEPEAVLAHDLAADPATLQMCVNRQGTEVGVRLIGVPPAPGSEPFADPRSRAGPDRDEVRQGPQSLDLDGRRLAGAGRRYPGHGD